MKVYFLIFISSLLFFSNLYSYEERNDSLIVQTLNFEDITKRSDSYLFPPLGNYEKIIMEYTLKCDPRTTQDRFDCGEWDYLTYTVITDSSGREKINRQSRRKYQINGSSPEEFQILNEAPKRNIFRFLELNSFFLPQENGEEIFGEIPESNGTLELNKGLYQFVFEKSELPEKINTLKFFNENENEFLRVIKVDLYKIKKDEFYDHQDGEGLGSYLGNLVFDDDLESNIQIADIDVNQLNDDDLLVMQLFIPEYENPNESLTLLSENSSTYEQMYLEDHSAGFFAGNSHLELPKEAFASIDSEISISFWVRGDANFLPKNTSIFEAVNNQNQRILNLHFPWNNSQVYWDAGNEGSGYDRVNKVMDVSQYMEGWNHWTFTKNTNSGDLKAYLNGEEFMAATDKNLSMSGIEKFVLGASWNARNQWHGWIRDFAIWDKELSNEEILENLDNQNSLFEPVLRYKMTNGEFGVDVSGNNFDANSFGELESHPFEDFDYISKNRSSRINFDLEKRPVIQFFYQERGNQRIDNNEFEFVPVDMKPSRVLVFDHDSVDDMIPIEEWEEKSRELNSPTDTLEYFLAQEYSYSYAYTENGLTKTPDSTLNENIETISNDEYFWYSPLVNYEIDRFITPYGIGLDLGDDGFTWKIDVTDYAPILHDWVRLSAGNQQELIDIKFIFIKGTPARDIIDLKTVYRRATYKYPQIVEDTHLPPVNMSLNPAASNWRVKTRSSGHRFGVDGTDNCAEFCNRLHSLWLDGSKEFEWEGWRECGDNPVYPQGGTWLLDRTDWCPGAPVTVYNHEITDFAKGKSSIEVDYEIEEKTEFTTYGDWVMNGMLVEYGEPNFQTNAAIDDILAPSTHDEYSRWNPVCDDAVIQVSNQGTETINNLEFSWEIEGVIGTYQWEGSLEFLESTQITIPLDYSAFEDFENPNKTFKVEITNVNGKEDEYPKNNSASSLIEETDTFIEDFVMQLRTNNWSIFEINYAPMNYGLYNLNTNEVVFEETGNLPNNNIVEETAVLDKGCYQIILENEAGYGLSYWVLDQYGFGKGYFRLGNGVSVQKTFETEFGNTINYNFRVGDKPKAIMDKKVLNFGKLSEGESKSLILKIEPGNNKGLEITSVSTGLGIVKGFEVINTIPSLESGAVTLEEGDLMEIEVQFTAKSSNLVTGELTIETNDAAKTTQTVELIANGETSVGLTSENIRLSVTPNPATGPIEINLGIETSMLLRSNLILSDALGNRIDILFDGDLSVAGKKIIYNTDDLASGVYYLTLTSSEISKTIPIVISN